MKRREFLGAVGASAFVASAKIAGSRSQESIEPSLTYLPDGPHEERAAAARSHRATAPSRLITRDTRR